MSIPGGYAMGETIYFTGASKTLSTGDKVVHGQQGEVVGPATRENHKGKGVKVQLPGNKGAVFCYLTSVGRLPAASALPSLHFLPPTPPPSGGWVAACVVR